MIHALAGPRTALGHQVSEWGGHPGVDDVWFIAALIDRLEADDQVDSDRVYMTGMSRGGMMSYRLGCKLARPAADGPTAAPVPTMPSTPRR